MFNYKKKVVEEDTFDKNKRLIEEIEKIKEKLHQIRMKIKETLKDE